MSSYEELWHLLLQLKNGTIHINDENTMLWAMHRQEHKPDATYQQMCCRFDPSEPSGGDAAALGLICWYRWFAEPEEAPVLNKCIELLTLAHNKGNVHGTHYLAKAYSRGYKSQHSDAELEVDNTKAVELFTIAHKKGFAPSTCFLGFACAQGRGVPYDGELVLQYYEQAANQGYRVAQKYLGSKLLRTQPEKAARYLRLSILNGEQANGAVHPHALLRKIAEQDAEAAAPRGDWTPDLHRYVLPQTHSEVFAALLMSRRANSALSSLPKDIILNKIIFFLCCRPFQRADTFNTDAAYVQGRMERALTQLSFKMETRLNRLEKKLDWVIEQFSNGK